MILLLTAVFGCMLSSSEGIQVAHPVSLSCEEAWDWWGCFDSEVWENDVEQGASRLEVDASPVLTGLAVTFGTGTYDLKGGYGQKRWTLDWWDLRELGPSFSVWKHPSNSSVLGGKALG